MARLKRRDWEWGTATARERLLHRLGVMATMAGNYDHLTGTATLARDMKSAVKRHWPRLSAIPTAHDSPLTQVGASRDSDPS